MNNMPKKDIRFDLLVLIFKHTNVSYAMRAHAHERNNFGKALRKVLNLMQKPRVLSDLRTNKIAYARYAYLKLRDILKQEYKRIDRTDWWELFADEDAFFAYVACLPKKLEHYNKEEQQARLDMIELTFSVTR